MQNNHLLSYCIKQTNYLFIYLFFIYLCFSQLNVYDHQSQKVANIQYNSTIKYLVPSIVPDSEHEKFE